MRYPCRISCEDNVYILQDILAGYLELYPAGLSAGYPRRISDLLPAYSDWVPAAAPWLCILPTGPVSAPDLALLCLCSE